MSITGRTSGEEKRVIAWAEIRYTWVRKGKLRGSPELCSTPQLGFCEGTSSAETRQGSYSLPIIKIFPVKFTVILGRSVHHILLSAY